MELQIIDQLKENRQLTVGQGREVRVSVLQWASSLLRLEKQRVTDSDEIGEKVPTD